MQPPVSYRKGSLADLEQLMELAEYSYGQFAEVLTEDNWKKMNTFLHNKEAFIQLIEKSAVFVCMNDKNIIGMAYLMPSGNPTPIYQSDWCYIRLVGVNPKYRGLGIAKKLTQLCIEYARETHEKMIALHTSEFMDSARHIYESIGFLKTKELEPIYGKKYWLYMMPLEPIS
jgi:ribosomal protein S18 acetylase RimI-like enzyme